MEFLYYAGAAANEDGEPIVECAVQFFSRDSEDSDEYTTAHVCAEWPPESPIAVQALMVEQSPRAQEMQERVRELLCHRIANCHGVTNDRVANCYGVTGLGCWALSSAGLAEIHLQVAEEFGHPKQAE